MMFNYCLQVSPDDPPAVPRPHRLHPRPRHRPRSPPPAASTGPQHRRAAGPGRRVSALRPYFSSILSRQYVVCILSRQYIFSILSVLAFYLCPRQHMHSNLSRQGILSNPSVLATQLCAHEGGGSNPSVLATQLCAHEGGDEDAPSQSISSNPSLLIIIIILPNNNYISFLMIIIPICAWGA